VEPQIALSESSSEEESDDDTPDDQPLLDLEALEERVRAQIDATRLANRERHGVRSLMF
jgi:hypothetical protein